MRIFHPKGFIPIVISGMAMNAAPQEQTFKYNEAEQKNIHFIQDSTKEYLKESQSSYSHIMLKVKFYDHLKKWKEETLFVSSPNQIVENENFQGMVKLGKPVVPFVVSELQRNPTYLVWVLNYIYGTKVSESPNITIPEAAKLWVKKIQTGEFS